MGTQRVTTLRKFPKLRYWTYTLMFPDGDVWVDQKPMVESFDVECLNMIAGHHDKALWSARMRQLRLRGFVSWKDAHKVEHLVVIENTKRRKRWGTDDKKSGLGSIQQGLTE